MGPSLLASGRAAPQPFPSIDALALHLLRQRPGRKLELLAQSCSCDGAEEFPVVAVFAVKPTVRKLPDGWTAHVQDHDWLGFTCGDDAADPQALRAAIDRMSSAGGLAA
ncbi:MAG: hypothetical protein JHC81_04760 [Brevundimonas sp.]|uniref:hypothetical protein n=1 Tax=Brevundimonas sp. TaxID=1871086 RepID=UPI001A18E3FE|nr:hypothetical protein [Brevundimonas sp.]MBJ7446825.1 hypothetical protein [Brevundimonas sp.]